MPQHAVVGGSTSAPDKLAVRVAGAGKKPKAGTARPRKRREPRELRKPKKQKPKPVPPLEAVEETVASPESTPLSDLDLIEGIKRESELHFNQLYDRYFQRIYNFVYGRIRNHADTEEIVQETFTVVFSSIEKYSGRSSLLSWIYGIAKNTTNNNLRQAKNTATRMQEIGHDPFRPTRNFASCTPEEQLSIQRYLRDVVEQLEDFGEWQVEIFEMRHLQNLSIREISERTLRSSDSVRSSLYRVKRLLMETAELDSPATP